MALDLPREIFIQEITTRLPIESLVRLRSVCKLWNSLFFDSLVFIQSNKKPSISQNPSNEYLILYNIKDSSTSLSILSRNNLFESQIDNVPCPLSRQSNFSLLGSINGLVCMICIQQHASYNFVLWNPVIHLSKKILLPICLNAFLLGFGWDSVEDDYKLIASSARQVSVYSFKTDCWSRNLLPDHLLITSCYGSFTSVIVKGNPYWRQLDFIAKFDVRIGNFKSVKLPNNKHRCCNLINMNNCLGFVDCGSYGVMDVYLFNDECCLWRKMYSFSNAGNYRLDMFPMCFTYGGEILLNGKYNLYDPKSSEIKTFGCEDNEKYVRGCSYTPSLLVLEGMTPLDRSAGRKRPTT